MKCLLLILGAAWLLTACVEPSPAQSPASLPAASPSALAFLSVSGLTAVDPATFRFEAGEVDALRTPRWEQTFTVVNRSKQPITIAKLRGSCGCETLLLLKDGAQVPQIALKPGEQAAIRLGVHLSSSQSGPVRKYVWADGPDTSTHQASPLATLEVDLTLRPSLSFTPTYLDFGKVEAGAGATQSLTVSLDADLFKDTDLPSLKSADTNISVKPTGPIQHVDTEGKAMLRQTYQVTLSPSAPAGRVSSDLRFLAPLPGGPGSPLAAVSVSVSGTVSGALDALPATVFFGSLPAGKPVTRSVVLTASSPAIARSLSSQSSASWLRATLDPADSSAKHRLLTITLTDAAPAGTIQEKITVTSAGGDRLDIPVIAELTK